MKVLALIAALTFSSQIFASTAFSFHCEFNSGGACMIEEATAMQEVQKGLFAGTEGDYSMYYIPGSGQMSIYLNDDMISFAQNADILAALNENKDGMVGVILGDEASTLKSIDASKFLTIKK